MKPRRVGAVLLRVGFCVAVVAPGWLFYLEAEARQAFRARLEPLLEDVEAYRARPAERPSVVATPADDDAVSHYEKLQALAVELRVQRRFVPERLWAAAEAGSLTAEERAVVEAWRPLTAEIYHGTQAARCDWDLDPDGAEPPTLELWAFERAAAALAGEAVTLEEPKLQVEAVAAIVGVGRDLRRTGSLAAVEVGLQIEARALGLLEVLLERGADPARVRAVLGEPTEDDPRGWIAADRLSARVRCFRAAGYTIGGVEAVSFTDGDFPRTAQGVLRVLDAYLARSDRWVEVLTAAPGELPRRAEAYGYALSAEPGDLVHRLAPGLGVLHDRAAWSRARATLAARLAVFESGEERS